ncbi:MAG: hypothetical protein AB8I08_37095 [Sandaracinaceae bacterium]
MESRSLLLLFALAVACGTAEPAEDGGMPDAGPPAVCAAAGEGQPAVTFAPVRPAVPYTQTEFEGFDVVSRVPADARGLVLMFHGTGGSADFANKVESVELQERFLAAGYGIAATESTDRMDVRRWDAALSEENVDIARLLRWIDALLTEHGLSPETPLYLVGMSNGAAFVGTFAHYLATETARPIRAVAMYQAGWRRSVFDLGAPVVPTFHVSVENEMVSDLPMARAQVAEAAAAGRPVVDWLVPEVPLEAARFLRINGVDTEQAGALFDHLVSIGIVDAEGERLVDADEATERLRAEPPAGLTVAEVLDVRSQLLAVWAMHQMRADLAAQNLAFFDCYGE